MIEVKSIRKDYDRRTHALRGVSFSIDKKITSIIGRNGAGKTTLLRILSTQLMPSSGTATINGYDVIKDTEEIRRMIVSIPQLSTPIHFLRAIDHVEIYLAARGLDFASAHKRAEKAMHGVGLWDVRNKKSDELSGGMKRKVFVAMALAADADIVFLDEPTTGLDPVSRMQIWAAIKRMKGQVVLTTHYMEEAQALSDEVILMDKGKLLAQGKVSQLLKPFHGLVRIESSKRKPSAHRMGGTWISYVKKEKAESFVMEGDIIKPVTLDDLFIKRGVDLES